MFRKISILALLLTQVGFAAQAFSADMHIRKAPAVLVEQIEKNGGEEVLPENGTSGPEETQRVITESGMIEGGYLENNTSCRIVLARVCNPYGWCRTVRTTVCS